MLHAKVLDASNQKIEISNAEKFLNSSKFGAIIYFVGTVRDINENKKVIGITYDSKDTMVIKSFEEIYKEAETKLNIKQKAVFIEHVKGYVEVEEKSIIIGVGCKHRKDAYNLSKERYDKGITTLESVLSSQRQYNSIQSQYLQLQRQAIENRLLLILAMGGDFDFPVEGSN